MNYQDFKENKKIGKLIQFMRRLSKNKKEQINLFLFYH